jgi:alpha-beta hydrolase superfamily lysophospholipase
VVKNTRGLHLQCSHWEPIAKQRPSAQMPCVIYLHGNCGCRADAVECLEEALTHGFTLLSCDLSGSGKSEGEYISLGWHEQDDVRALISHAQTKRDAGDIYLWGRSMGAVRSCGRACLEVVVVAAAATVAAAPAAAAASLQLVLFAVALRMRAGIAKTIPDAAGFRCQPYQTLGCGCVLHSLPC